MYYLLGTLIESCGNDEIDDIIKNNDPAANLYQSSLVEGFLQNNSYLTVFSYKTVSGNYYKNNKISLKNYMANHPNVLIRRKSYMFNLYDQFLFLLKSIKFKCNKDDTIIVYSLNSSRLLVSKLAKFLYKVNVCVIVTDLPQFMSDNKNIIYRVMKLIDRCLIKWCLRSVDSYVLLSEHMKYDLPIKNNKYVIVEGLYSINKKVPEIAKNKNDKKIILYTGTLAERYGVLNLITAFQKLKDSSFRLTICGSGGVESKIKEIASKDSRIDFLGSLSHELIIEMQMNASLLVNPRPPEGEYVKYSFPSKTMEYFASGTPVLMYKLSGIPKEYFNYCFYIEDLSINVLSRKIDEILCKDVEELNNLGKKAKEFILKYKNSKYQCSKILELINN